MRKEIIKLHEQGLSYREIANKLGKSKSLVAYYIRTKDCDWDTKEKEKSQKEKEFHELVINIVKESNNLNQVCRKMNLRSTNENYQRINKIINLYSVDISHFTNEPKRLPKHQYTLDEIFCFNTTASKNLIKKSLKTLRPHKCEKCQRTEWEFQNQLVKIPLQVHHINGDRTDNRLSNLQLLCPNCHALTDNYCGKNKK